MEKKTRGLTYEVANLYAKGISMTQIRKDKDSHQETVKREVRKALKWFVEHYEASEGKEPLIAK